MCVIPERYTCVCVFIMLREMLRIVRLSFLSVGNYSINSMIIHCTHRLPSHARFNAKMVVVVVVVARLGPRVIR